MNTDILQTLRYALQKRVRRLNSIRDDSLYLMALRHFWHFLQSKPLFWGIIEDLRARCAGDLEQVRDIVEGRATFVPNTEEEQAALACALIGYCLQTDDASPIFHVGYRLRDRAGSAISEDVEQFHELLTEPLYEYIDEQVDAGRAVLGLLVRYKHRCEWFRREVLFGQCKASPDNGEAILAMDLYEYLFDQGVEFSIEPWSASGRADLVAAQAGSDERLVADAKIFDPEAGKGKSNLAKGVHQLYIYTQDYNQPVGYLVVFKTSDADLRFAVSDTTSGIPVLNHNNKSLFLLVVDIYPHTTPASKRGKAKVVEINEGDLLVVESSG